MSGLDANRNLLFGLLALQNNFVGRDALVSAFGVWVADKSRDLGQILVEQGALDSDVRALLGALVGRHLEIHGGDADKSLAGLGMIVSIHKELAAVADPDLNASLCHVSASHRADDDPYATHFVSNGDPMAAGGRFRVLRFHARGGLGQVSIALDQELGREVALKEIRESRSDDPNSRARFRLEAEVTGGLEHPGIVPVYGLGHDACGRPYYAMRFIRGDNLHEAIERFHRVDVPGRDPGERSLTFRKLLRRFVDVCNAVAYAHSRGVLHRDLKPSNVMLGPYGETLVVDWGLAKLIGQRESSSGEAGSDERPLKPSSASETGDTQAGSRIGTLGFMSPEQAEGRMDLLGPASDVYSLGATLYVLLTGRTPFDVHDPTDVLVRVLRGDFPPPRQANPLVAPALDAICRKAMALRTEDRYRSPRALSDDIEHWLADEPVTAWREPATARLVRWGRRNRSTVTALVVLLATAMGVSTVGAVLLGLERGKTRVQKQVAEKNLTRALVAVDGILNYLGDARLSDIPQMDAIWGPLHERSLQFYKDFLEAYRDNPAVSREAGMAYYRVGKILYSLSRHDESRDHFDRAIRLQRSLVARFPYEVRDRYDLALSLSGLGRLLRDERQFSEAKSHYSDSLNLLNSLVAQAPDNPEYRRRLSQAYMLLGNLLNATRRGPEVGGIFDQALKLQEHLAASFPEDPNYREDMAQLCYTMGIMFKDEGQFPAAERSLRRAVELQERLVEARPGVPRHRQDLALSHHGSALLMLAQRRSPEAEQFFNQAIQGQKRLVEDFSRTPVHRHNLGRTYRNYAAMLAADGRHDEAHYVGRSSLDIWERLVQDFPRHRVYRYDLATSLHNLSLQHPSTQAGRTEAESLLTRAIEVINRLATDFPEDPSFRVTAATILTTRAALFWETRRLEEAEEAYRKALELLSAVANHHPEMADYRAKQARVLDELGDLLKERARQGNAREFYSEALGILESLDKSHPTENNQKAMKTIKSKIQSIN